ncbi:MAG TPA: TetR/AcrR family transcriptional regulator [Thermomicrobiales bacterium]|nr:TetR/AcrR family transcriptional regulator [Thermomicrobiales bacterium]
MGSDEIDMLAGGFSALWKGVRDGGSRSRAGLSLEEIVSAAVEIADERGLADVSMARVAKRVGYSTMALYRHVPNKGELLALMFDAGVGEPPDHLLQIPGWRARLHEYATVFATIFRRRPWLIDIPVSGPPVGPNNIAMLNIGLTALEETGLDIRDRLDVFMVLTNYLLGTQRLEIEMSRTGEAARQAGAAVNEAVYGRVLRRLLPPGKYAAVDAAIAAGAFDDEDEDTDAQLHHAVDHILDGIELLMKRRGVSSPD